jgi:hypothetical protein
VPEPSPNQRVVVQASEGGMGVLVGVGSDVLTGVGVPVAVGVLVAVGGTGVGVLVAVGGTGVGVLVIGAQTWRSTQALGVLATALAPTKPGRTWRALVSVKLD